MDITIRIPTPREALSYWKAALLLAVLALMLVWAGADTARAAGGGNTITSPDTTGKVGSHTSLQLDASGNPVVSHFDGTNNALKVLHCDDPNCAGGGESITSPDTAGAVGTSSSLQLDASGNPVVSYQDLGASDLKVLHCDDPNCAGGGESITSPDTTGSVGADTSLQLDASGNPVISYWDFTNMDLKVLHCDDPNCAGGGESITSPDTAGAVGASSSLQLDASGNPVISYGDLTNGALKVFHCDDPNCAGGGESITSPDTTGSVGADTSLQLDASGNPVISYWDFTNMDLKVLHCDDPNCAGGGESITSPDTVSGGYTSLELDISGFPVVSYYGVGDLKLLHCNDANCASGGESITSPDTTGSVGAWTSLALDASGSPVVSYRDDNDADLKLLHCVDQNCAGVKGPSEINITNVTQLSQPKTCFDVMDSGQTFLFTACDNDFQGAPVSHAACDDGIDTICDDEDPTEGSVTITVDPAIYNVEAGKTPLNITADATTGTCSGGGFCLLTFTNTTGVRPWFPWDVSGGGGQCDTPPDGVVDLANDILCVIKHFQDTKP